jgi:hypothetical protein
LAGASDAAPCAAIAALSVILADVYLNTDRIRQEGRQALSDPHEPAAPQ